MSTNGNGAAEAMDAVPDALARRLLGTRSDLISALHETEQTLIWLGVLSYGDRALLTRDERRAWKRDNTTKG